jgi:glyoxylase-like metal-dependent hydrolase (beta-lactamase superfamily II)
VKILYLVGITILVISTLLVINRQSVMLSLFAATIATPELAEKSEEGEGVTWFDDYYTIQHLDDQTIAIGEPRYYQQNYNYLILGNDRAILFDSGPGVRDIKPVVESLTELPVTVTQSHLHFDHVGNHTRFDSIAMIDLPYLRERANNGKLALNDPEHLGYIEGFKPPELNITEWWQPGESIELGGRSLKVIHAPGHTKDSMILLDTASGQLFSGDYLYKGELFAFLPGSDLSEYLETATALNETIESCTAIYAAHRLDAPGAPILQCNSIDHLKHGLEDIRDGQIQGKGLYPTTFDLGKGFTIMTDNPWFVSWTE